MTDIEIAKKHLDGHSICLCRDNDIITDGSRGIAPMMKFIASGKNLQGYSAADIIVGKAAAMLFVKAGFLFVNMTEFFPMGKKAVGGDSIRMG